MGQGGGNYNVLTPPTPSVSPVVAAAALQGLPLSIDDLILIVAAPARNRPTPLRPHRGARYPARHGWDQFCDLGCDN